MDLSFAESRVLIIMTGYVEFLLIQTIFPMMRLALEAVKDPFPTLGSHSTDWSHVNGKLTMLLSGTICMKKGPNGLVPARGFLESGMAPRPSFNDLSNPDDIVIVDDDGSEIPYRSLRTPVSTYQKHVRYAVFEFQELLDSSSISSGS